MGWLKFQSTRPARDATWSGAFDRQREWRFNPRAPRGTRLRRVVLDEAARMFQSTRPARDATGAVRRPGNLALVSIHAPRAGRDRQGWQSPGGHARVSIHAPRAGRDSVFGALKIQYDVSIHAPRAGRDFNTRYHRARARLFQSTRPARDATTWSILDGCSMKFQSTRPARDATRCNLRPSAGQRVSIHAPRAGRDRVHVVLDETLDRFQSTRPARDATSPRRCHPPDP